MIPQHHQAFVNTARTIFCWICLREPNTLSDKYAALSSYAAKGKHCKAKTSNNPAHPFGGLVVSPEIHPSAFIDEIYLDAKNKWLEFDFRLPQGHTYSKEGPDKGLVKYHGKPIHADYDLMAVCKADTNGKMIYTEGIKGNIWNPQLYTLANQVREMLNASFGKEMIMHGTEFDYKGVGARDTEKVWWYGPKGEFFINESSMPKKMPN